MTGRAEILSARLILRPLRAQDEAPACAALGQPEVAQWLGSLPHPHSPQDFRDFRARSKRGRVWAMELARSVGETCACPLPAGSFLGVIALDPDLGYWLTPQAQGFGFVREAAREVIAAHFANPAARDLESGYFLDNTRSCQVLTLLGFTQSGPVREMFCRPRGLILPHVDMVLTRAGFAAADPAG